MIDCDEWKTEKRHECTNMGKGKRLELWWQLYVTWLPVRDLESSDRWIFVGRSVPQNCVTSIIFCKSNITLLHTVKACGAMKVKFHIFLTLTLRRRCVFCCTLSPLQSLGTSPMYPRNGSQFGCSGEDKNIWFGWKLNCSSFIIQPTA